MACQRALLISGRALSGGRWLPRLACGRRQLHVEKLNGESQHPLKNAIRFKECQLTGNCEIAEKFIRVWGPQPFGKIDSDEFAANDRGDVERLELVENTAQLQRLLVLAGGLRGCLHGWGLSLLSLRLLAGGKRGQLLLDVLSRLGDGFLY